MPVSVQQPCPAKVNLFLEITGKRRDGYHLLATLFAKLSLCDDLFVEAVEDDPAFTLEVVDEIGQGLKAERDNLVLRAAQAFRDAFGLRMGAHFTLTKRIPLGAGLGGGSSDAAAAMIALARLYRIDLNRTRMSKLKRVAAALGADIPFFLRHEGICEGYGIGDKLKPVTTEKGLPWMILVFPGVSVATKDVYGRLKRPDRAARLTRLSHLDKLTRKLEKGRPISEWEGLLFNRLEDAVLDSHNEVRQAKDILRRLGLQGVLMSGSGASVFGFVRSREEGERVLAKLKGYPWKVFLACCVG
ncbi:MAG: 4-(cytidine 5'-diphospho)-2-C-methyl-D-erythritol kinase [Elusimicrobia bacterium CG1_02_63_36]|nr:MAG: 4-(cytidine 5'-diphospho)-2-C-methyl-D-erythritol kinase [Elusimicrobia bacterium CG1_02_63_36]PIP82798.1 MAG: 4-(cytidine 5'-diphospho)-2-C-methyl-D-erythritol kinase [Elusimicrobia bacterium CG22_combo_CG10-13_8_21_14_all_63_91]PJA16105.1 MAG: 4-(cytidine 5'-diphospho)-2-C-methyl-D-erythritol kinase [Elusimicrobia bacterium CG_4_10_14_0_2_um_filter_63_34]PJB24692.1 MAG: 4-(cytidine 5'-diphospho)-2-C-methyl-D-erythritol kinase [Elusimicrobia bacterium CG_4_9_14_3_um_filter_62_55]